MAPRKSRKAAKQASHRDYNNLQLKEVICPICRGILIEPVTLSCNHDFCLSCFEGTMANTNLVCPLCRLRIASWLRAARKENRLVNKDYWKAIQLKFPLEVSNKLEGREDTDINTANTTVFEEDCPKIKIADPGEIRREYEIERQKENDERQRLKEKEEKASEDLLNKLQEELEHEKALEEEKLRLDEEVARRLSKQLVHQHQHESPGPSKSCNLNNKNRGTLDDFLIVKPHATNANNNCHKIKTSFLESRKQKNSNSKSKSQDLVFSEVMQKDFASNNNCNVMLKTFADKEYKAIILKQPKQLQGASSLSNLSFIQKKSMQLQKLTDSECISDNSDCIESECRYFKPIEHKLVPHSTYKSPIKVPAKKPMKISLCDVRAPNGGKYTFSIDFSNSAFVRYKLGTSPQFSSGIKDTLIKIYKNSSSSSKTNTNDFKGKSLLNNKRQLVKTGAGAGNNPKKKLKTEHFHNKIVPLKKNGSLTKLSSISSSSHRSSDHNSSKNGLHDDESDSESNESLRKQQEDADLEFARRLHEQLNGGPRYPRRGNLHRRQVKLDEIIVPCKIK